jgi:hypothetical protein
MYILWRKEYIKRNPHLALQGSKDHGEGSPLVTFLDPGCGLKKWIFEKPKSSFCLFFDDTEV